jgi:hypothetical protein
LSRAPGAAHDDRVGRFARDEAGDRGVVANIELYDVRPDAAVRRAHDLPAGDIREFLRDRPSEQARRADHRDLETRPRHHAPAEETTV